MTPVPLSRYLPQIALATLLVAVCPILLAWWLRASGAIGAIPGMALAMALSLGASWLGSTYWKKRTGSGDMLFAELMIWGFVRRWRNERRLESALETLGSMNQAQRRNNCGLTAEAQARALEQLSRALEATDPHTSGHSHRVARHSAMIAKQMGLRPEAVDRIRTAAALHDVGKIHTPTAVLRKPGKLTDEEFDEIKRHPVDGARMADVLGDAELTSIVRHHHERLDGTGYPDRLTGDQIPIGARIIAVADTFDAITSARPYRSACSHKKALDILKYEAGTQLDPGAVRAFCKVYSGRRLIALWASLTTLPGQALSWLGGGVAGVVTATQVAAVAGATAVGAVMIPHPPAHPARPHGLRASIATIPARRLESTQPAAAPALAPAITVAYSGARRRTHRRYGRIDTFVGARAPSSASASSSSGASPLALTPPASSNVGSPAATQSLPTEAKPVGTPKAETEASAGGSPTSEGVAGTPISEEPKTETKAEAKAKRKAKAKAEAEEANAKAKAEAKAEAEAAKAKAKAEAEAKAKARAEAEAAKAKAKAEAEAKAKARAEAEAAKAKAKAEAEAKAKAKAEAEAEAAKAKAKAEAEARAKAKAEAAAAKAKARAEAEAE